MSVTTYEVLSANTVSELVALVNAATGKRHLVRYSYKVVRLDRWLSQVSR